MIPIFQMKTLRLYKLYLLPEVTIKEVAEKWLRQVHQLPYLPSKITLPYCLSLRCVTNTPFGLPTFICIHGLFLLLNYKLLEFIFFFFFGSCYLQQKGQVGTREGGKIFSSDLAELKKH